MWCIKCTYICQISGAGSVESWRTLPSGAKWIRASHPLRRLDHRGWWRPGRTQSCLASGRSIVVADVDAPSTYRRKADSHQRRTASYRQIVVAAGYTEGALQEIRQPLHSEKSAHYIRTATAWRLALLRFFLEANWTLRSLLHARRTGGTSRRLHGDHQRGLLRSHISTDWSLSSLLSAGRSFGTCGTLLWLYRTSQRSLPAVLSSIAPSCSHLPMLWVDDPIERSLSSVFTSDRSVSTRRRVLWIDFTSTDRPLPSLRFSTDYRDAGFSMLLIWSIFSRWIVPVLRLGIAANPSSQSTLLPLSLPWIFILAYEP